jgi:hypothetical protein
MSIYLRLHIEVGVGTFLLTPTPAKIPSNCDSTALVHSHHSATPSTHKHQ